MRIFAPLNQDLIPALQTIEVSTSFQIPYFQIIGLPAPEVSEARERIRAAIDASGFEFPRKRVVLNLSPAAIRKKGTGLDLPMALGVLNSADTEHDDGTNIIRILAWGELGLNGTLKPAGQGLRTLYAAWSQRISHLILSAEDEMQTKEWFDLIAGSRIFHGSPPSIHIANTLKEAWSICERIKKGMPASAPLGATLKAAKAPSPSPDLLPLPSSLERMIGVAASGFHHVLLLGPKGVGKSRVLDWLIHTLPALDPRTQLDHRLMTELLESEPKSHFSHHHAVRKVSAHVKPAALMGGGGGAMKSQGLLTSSIRPGEFSLAHGGLLIADELPEWPRDSREAFREPLESGTVTLTRVHGSSILPARFALAATGNICPCGGWPNELPVSDPLELGRVPTPCDCSLSQRRTYLKRLSGPILDRIDLVRLVSSTQTRTANSNLLEQMRNRVVSTQERLIRAYGELPGKLKASELERILSMHSRLKSSLDSDLNSNLRSRHKIFRVALTLSAWDECENPTTAHLTEARTYRPERLGSLAGFAPASPG